MYYICKKITWVRKMLAEAKYYFDQIQYLLEDEEMRSISVIDRYAELYRILNEMTNEVTEKTGLLFAGPFARITYLVKEYGIDHDLYTRINAFRSLCKNTHETEVSLLNRHLSHDAKTVAQFISGVAGEDIPANLASLLPKDIERWKIKQVNPKYMRISVEEWDDDTITGVADNAEEDIVKICYSQENYFGDWSYIKSLLKKGAQINIIHPVKKKDVYYAELIIFEPDYLIDISSIAGTFKDYGVTPFTYLLNKFKKSANSKAILLGNIAGQILDQEINAPCQTEYKDTATTFFRNNSLSIVTCPDSLDTFHHDAQEQQKNIRDIIDKAVASDSNFELDKLVVEPSFFCEMLGIQGRMDLMHTEYKVLLEQKSGKRGFPNNTHKEEHYVQMLLYLALLHYNFNLNNEDISCYLLYSKFPDGLIKEGPAPKLLFEALKVRNQIVWNEFYLGEGGIKVLDKITPDRVNVKRLATDFFRKYELPDIVYTLSTIQSASELEKNYFFRMFTFMHREHILSKVSNSRKEANGLASLWNCTLEEKKLAGVILDGLTLDEESVKESSKTMVWYSPEGDDEYLPNFRDADSVIIYKYSKDSVPDARRGIVYRGYIECMIGNKIVVTLRSEQKNHSQFISGKDTLWAMEHDYMDSTSNSVNRGLFAFLEAHEDRRQLILAQREPQRDESQKLVGDYGNFNDLVLRAKQAQDYFIVIGPPGTGKTSFGMLNILKETLYDDEASVLIMSFTNRAVDEICSKLVKEGIDFLRIGRESLCAEPYKEYMLENKMKNCKDSKAIKEVLTRTRVVVGTTSSIAGKIEIFTLRHFSLAIIDEASQILEPQLLPILSAKHGNVNGIRKFVLIGDHKQLTAVVQQSVEETKVTESLLNDIHLYNCRNSLFERLLSLQDAESSPLVYRLTRQGRMHHDVALFSSRAFYEGKLTTVPLAHQEADIDYPIYDDKGMELLLASRRMAFINVERPQRSSSCKVNAPEAKVIASIVYAAWNLYTKNGKEFIPEDTVGVIVPYRNQISVVRKEIDKYGIPEIHDITIDTVERYQGSERDIIIYGFTVQREYQLAFLTNNVFEENGSVIDRKLNVALTRAREHTVIVGNKPLLEKNEVFKQLFAFIPS